MAFPHGARYEVPVLKYLRLSWCSNRGKCKKMDKWRKRGGWWSSLCQKSLLPRHGGGCIVVTMSSETIVSGSPISHRGHAVPRTGPASRENVRAVLLSCYENARDPLARSRHPRRLEPAAEFGRTNCLDKRPSVFSRCNVSGRSGSRCSFTPRDERPFSRCKAFVR